jgi:predicted PurR-regulated permease PerM
MKKRISHWFQKISSHVEERRREFEQSQKEQAQKSHISHTILPHHANETQKMEIDISVKTIVKIILVIALFLAAKEILVELSSILVMTFVSAILVLGISPMLDRLEAHKIPRPLAIVILYLLFLGVLTIFFIQLVPIIIRQLTAIAYDLRGFFAEPINLPTWTNSLGLDAKYLSSLLENNVSTIAKNLQSVAGSTFSIVGSIFSSVVNLIMTLTLLFFMFLERERLGLSILKLFPTKNQHIIQKRTIAVQSKMAEWFRGQFILMIIVGLFVYIWMSVLHFTLGFEYAVTVALLAAFAELLPYVGPFITYVLVGLIGIEISGSAFVIGLLCVGMTQFLEGNFLVPIVMKRAVGISSVVVILALLIGGSLGYAIGGIGTAIVAMIFSIPIAATIGMFLDPENPR